MRSARRGQPAERRGFALTTMQRRLASSTRAIRPHLERRVERIDRALADPEEYLRSKKAFQAEVLGDDDLDDLDEQELVERQRRSRRVAAADRGGAACRAGVTRAAARLADEAEEARADWKLKELLEVVKSEGLRRIGASSC
ncbi:MAG: hypothetical protein M5T61_17675 [Acidimicrobiia bacterium]|nr:hypothetical protein [Acidimicrobiia bacterium]